MTRYFAVHILTVFIVLATLNNPLYAQTDSLPPVVVDSLEVSGDTIEETLIAPIDFESIPIVRQKLKRTAYPGGWFFLLNCGLLLLLSLKFLVFQQYSRKSWNALVNENLFFQFIREKSPVNFSIVVIETLLKLYMVSFATLLILMLLKPGMFPGPEDLFRIMLVFAIFYAVKSIVSLVLASLTDNIEYYKIQNLSNVIVSSNAALLLIPLILLVMYLSAPFREYGIYVVLFVFAATATWLVFRSVRIVSKTGMPFNLQFFLYLCAFEILPYLFIVKIFEKNLV